MKIKRFNKEEDYNRVIEFLRDNYRENNNISSPFIEIHIQHI